MQKSGVTALRKLLPLFSLGEEWISVVAFASVSSPPGTENGFYLKRRKVAKKKKTLVSMSQDCFTGQCGYFSRKPHTVTLSRPKGQSSTRAGQCAHRPVSTQSVENRLPFQKSQIFF